MSDVVGYRVAIQEQRAAALKDRVQQLLAPFDGTERALDSGCGAGALAFALAPFVEHVVGVDRSAELVAAGNELAPPNCELIVGDATALPFEYGSFDIAGCMRVLHHARRPELVVSELARVTRPGGRILLVDQLGFVDPVVSAETDRFEQARDPSHTRLLPDQDIRFLLDANDLEVLTNEIAREERDLERYLDLVGLEGDERRRVSGMAPGAVYEVEIGWYVARKRGGLSLRRQPQVYGVVRVVEVLQHPGRRPRQHGLRHRAEAVREPRHDQLRLPALDRRERPSSPRAPGRSRTAARAASRGSSDAGTPASSRTRA